MLGSSFLLSEPTHKMSTIQKFINTNQRFNLGILVLLYALVICLEFFILLSKFLKGQDESWNWVQTAKIIIDALVVLALVVLFRAFTKQPTRLKNYLLYFVLWIFLLNETVFGYIKAATDDSVEIYSLGSMGILVSRVFVMHLMIMSLPIQKFLRVLPALFASLVSLGFIGLKHSENELHFFLELFLCLLTSVFLGLLLSKKQDFLFEIVSSAIQELSFCTNIIKGIPVGVLLTDLDYKILYKNNQMQNYFDTLPPNLRSPQDLFRQFKGAEIPEEGLVTFFKDAFHQRHEGGDTTNSNMEVCLEDVLDIMFRNYKVVENALRGSVPQEMYSVDSLPNSIKFRMKNLDTTIEVKVFPIQVGSKDCALLLFLDHTERVVPLLGGQDSNSQYQFLASLSHELRTPLNSALALVQSSITEPTIPEESKDKLLFPAFHSMQILSYNIKDLIDFSKASCGGLGLKLENCNITSLIEKMIKLMEIQANKKSISIFSKIDPEIPSDWITDPDRVCQTILNLLSNAIKYTVKGFIVVSAKYLERTNMIKIKVSDTGIGMEKGDLNKLQKAFKDQELYFKKLNLHSTGIGLGLAVSNQICLVLGHNCQDYLKVKSTLNKGSEFKFYIDNKARINLTSFDSPANGTVETHESLLADSSTMKLRQMRRGVHSTNNRYMTRKESVFSPHRSPKVLKEFPSKDVDTMEDNKGDDSLDASSDSSPSLYANTSLLNQRYLSFDSNMKRGSGVVAQFGSRHHSPLLREVKLLNNEIDRPSKVDRVLIVDDDSFNILSLELMFKNFNIEHDHAYNGREAVEKVKNNKYQMIMMDCNMPVMDGWEATKQIIGLINEGVIDNLVIVACTAFEDSENLMKCGEAGMKYIIQKPVSVDKLSDLLRKIAS